MIQNVLYLCLYFNFAKSFETNLPTCDRVSIRSGVLNNSNVTCWVYVRRQITSRRIEYSEFIPLALTFTQFTILQLLPSAVSHLLLLLSATATIQLTRQHLVPYCVTPDHTLPSHTARPAFYTVPCCLVLQRCTL
jgi:hypothetical protein